MIELERSLAAYATFLDEQSLGRSPDHIIQSDPDEGEVIMVDIQIQEPGTDRPDDEMNRRRWARRAILAAAAVILVIVAVALFDGAEESTQIDVVDAPSDDAAPDAEESTQIDVVDDPEPETTEPGDPDGETEEPNQRDSVTFASLTQRQQRIIGGLCQAVEDARAGAAFDWDDTWVESVYLGDAGVPAMGAAINQAGPGQDPGEYLERVGPICDEIGWAPTG